MNFSDVVLFISFGTFAVSFVVGEILWELKQGKHEEKAQPEKQYKIEDLEKDSREDSEGDGEFFDNPLFPPEL